MKAACKGVDFGAGPGLFVRLMRSSGFNFEAQDKYAETLFANYFSVKNAAAVAPNVLTAFEVFEHLPQPRKTIELLLKDQPAVVLFTTWFNDGQPEDWIYYLPECGQHVFFYSDRGLRSLAVRHNYKMQVSQYFHILSNTRLLTESQQATIDHFCLNSIAVLNNQIQSIITDVIMGNEHIDRDFALVGKIFDKYLAKTKKQRRAHYPVDPRSTGKKRLKAGKAKLIKPEGVNYQELVEKVKALYRRLAEDKLLPADILDSEKAFFPDKTDFMERIYADRELFEQHFARFADTYDVFRIFGAEKVILDVGADWGYSALSMRRRGTQAVIFSVEANPYSARVLAVLKKMENGRYNFVEVAATQKVEELSLFIPAINGVANPGSSSTGGTLSDPFAYILADLVMTNPAPAGEPDKPQLIPLKVAGKPLDLIAKEYGILDRIAAIKIDVEGHEASALQGAMAIMRQQRPMIMVESANREPDVRRAFAGTGYNHFERQAGKLVRYDAISGANDGFWVHESRESEYVAAGLI
jgi:FkbM family methyltransferase